MNEKLAISLFIMVPFRAEAFSKSFAPFRLERGYNLGRKRNYIQRLPMASKSVGRLCLPGYTGVSK